MSEALLAPFGYSGSARCTAEPFGGHVDAPPQPQAVESDRAGASPRRPRRSKTCRTVDSGTDCQAFVRSTARFVRSTARFVRSTARFVKSTARFVRSTARFVKSTAQVVKSTARFVKSTARFVRSTEKLVNSTEKLAQSTAGVRQTRRAPGGSSGAVRCVAALFGGPLPRNRNRSAPHGAELHFSRGRQSVPHSLARRT